MSCGGGSVGVIRGEERRNGFWQVGVSAFSIGPKASLEILEMTVCVGGHLAFVCSCLR